LPVVTPIELRDVAATEAAGARCAQALSGGMVLTLSGELGAGKTTFVRGLLRGLGWDRTVKSPSYTVVEHYPFSRLYFYHFDFYRFADPGEWETAGLAECFNENSVCVIEWPERVGALVPVADLALTLSLVAPEGQDDRRRLQGVAATAAGARCLNAIAAAPGR
jgi:tRNA threonylcarbamoyladenosine biosynthesis protein TsaE